MFKTLGIERGEREMFNNLDSSFRYEIILIPWNLGVSIGSVSGNRDSLEVNSVFLKLICSRE